MHKLAAHPISLPVVYEMADHKRSRMWIHFSSTNNNVVLCDVRDKAVRRMDYDEVMVRQKIRREGTEGETVELSPT